LHGGRLGASRPFRGSRPGDDPSRRGRRADGARAGPAYTPPAGARGAARARATRVRVVEEGEVRRIGENVPRKVDARVVAATNRSLEEEVRSGRFRADLRFRLDVVRIRVPPLRERADEIPWLAERIWVDAAARVGTRARLGEDLLAALARYDWPGNVRELQNVIAALAVHGPPGGRVRASQVPAHIGGAGF